MGKVTSSCFLTFLLCLYVFSTTCEASRWNEQKQGKTWCIAKIFAPNDKLQAFLEMCCSKYNCGDIKPGGSCYDPNTLQNHASYALDLYFRKTGDCNADICTTAITDPSFGSCHYP